MRIRSEHLRQSAPLALTEQGFSSVELVSGPGIVPGARLRAVKDGATLIIAVRTSSDREVGLLRTIRGHWRTIPNVDLVLIAVPANDELAIEVLAFEPSLLLEVFDDRVRAIEKNKHDRLRFKSPVFVALDDVKSKKNKEAQVGLHRKSTWRSLIPLDQLTAAKSALGDGEERAMFFDGIKKQIANFVGVDVSKIELTISIKS